MLADAKALANEVEFKLIYRIIYFIKQAFKK